MLCNNIIVIIFDFKGKKIFKDYIYLDFFLILSFNLYLTMMLKFIV